MRRIFVISDLHIGGNEHPMLGHPEILEDFLNRLAAQSQMRNDELELVINGDFIDFLAHPPGEAWTSNEHDAVLKFKSVVKGAPHLFAALRRCATNMSRFTVLLGNHDIELAYPKVRDALLHELGLDTHRSLLLFNNEAYRVGDLLIEHGNRYDAWNAIDHNGLRQIVSSCSRGEQPPSDFNTCPGSRLVQEVINPLKHRYQFIDLLKPEDKLVVLLLTTIEPQLRGDLGKLLNGATSYARQVYRKALWTLTSVDRQPGQRQLVSREDSVDSNEWIPREVIDTFSDEMAIEERSRRLVSTGGNMQKRFLKDDDEESLALLLKQGREPAPDRLRKLQIALRNKLRGDDSFIETDETGPEFAAAREMIQERVAKAVVMGHTHLAREIKVKDGWYINTGTWADLISLDRALLDDSEHARIRFFDWLHRLATNRLEDIRVCEPGYSAVSLDRQGYLQSIRLGRHKVGAPLP